MTPAGTTPDRTAAFDPGRGGGRRYNPDGYGCLAALPLVVGLFLLASGLILLLGVAGGRALTWWAG